MRSTHRIIIIGGGIVGCGLAYHLARRGRKVVVAEGRNIAGGATGRCGGMVMKIDGRDTDRNAIATRWRYVSENDRMLDRFQEELDVDFGLLRRGSLDIAMTEEEEDLLRGLAAMQREGGDQEIQYLNRDSLLKLAPIMGPNVKGARFRPSDGILDPFKLTHALLAGARKKGAEVRTWTKVIQILFEDATAVGVRTDHGDILGDIVINATNGWAANLVPDIPVVPLRALAVITEPAPPLPAFTFEAEMHTKIVYGGTQTKRGNILVGGPPEFPATREEQFNEHVSLQELQFNTSVITELLPGIRKLNVIRAWSGAMGVTPDGMPCVGPVPGREGLYVAAGYPNGMSYAPVTARLLAELITDGEPSIPLEALDPARFAGQTYDWPQEYDYTVLAEYLGRTG